MASIDFALARLVHRTWKFKLRAFLNGEQRLTEAEKVSSQECDLGKWLYTEAQEKYSDVPEVAQLEVAHDQLHASARRIVHFKESGQAAKAEQEFSKVALLSGEIISLLTTLEQKV